MLNYHLSHTFYFIILNNYTFKYLFKTFLILRTNVCFDITVILTNILFTLLQKVFFKTRVLRRLYKESL